VELGLPPTTVTGAYQELEARGLVRGHVGRGTVVVGGPGELAHGAFPWAQRASALATEGVQIACGTMSRTQDLIALDSGWPDPNLYPAVPGRAGPRGGERPLRRRPASR
jgi:DNA-binding transcriptional MocR family regulator